MKSSCPNGIAQATTKKQAKIWKKIADAAGSLLSSFIIIFWRRVPMDVKIILIAIRSCQFINEFYFNEIEPIVQACNVFFNFIELPNTA